MNVRIFHGSKKEIAEEVARVPGEVTEAIVFIEEPSESAPRPEDDIFTEMAPFTVATGGADYSREALYSRMDGE